MPLPSAWVFQPWKVYPSLVKPFAAMVAWSPFQPVWPAVSPVASGEFLSYTRSALQAGSRFHCAYRVMSPFRVTACLSVYLVPLPSFWVFQESNSQHSFEKPLGVRVVVSPWPPLVSSVVPSPPLGS